MKKKKNIAIIIPSLSGGGAERVASILSQYLAYENNVYLFLNQLDKKSTYPHAGKVVLLQRNGVSKSKLGQASWLLRQSIQLRKLKAKYKIDLAISFMEESNYLNVLSRRNEKIILRVCTILSERVDEFRDSIMYQKNLLSFIYNRADAVVVMTQYAKRDMVKNWNINPKKLTIIENPLNFKHIEQSLQEQIDWSYGNNTVVSINRMDTVKRQWHLIKAFSEVIKQVPDASLLFVGDGKCKNRLKVLTKRLKLENHVFFVGHQNNIYPYLKNSKVYVLTSKTEGFPNGMIEALYVGIPVISLDCPGAPKEILCGEYKSEKVEKVAYAKYGILVTDMKDCSDNELSEGEIILSEAIVDVILNEKTFKRYKNNAVSYVNRYNMSYIGGKWDELIY